MRSLDQIFEHSSRSLARRTSRRSLLGTLGQVLTGAALLPLLPIDRASRAQAAEGKTKASGPESCDYWKYCAIDGFLCSCCGGTSTSCPPGTGSSPITWVGTCHNPGDGRDYIVSYNDCCGKASCGRCLCNRNENDKPLYMPFASNDYNWCAGSQVGIAYNCSTARIVGVAK